jgi:uncharacterized Zn-finger protein
MHSGEHPHVCGVGNKGFNDKSSLITHEHIHSGERPYSCDVCNKAFNDKRSLIRHTRIHTGERPYVCDVCNKAFSDKPSLITHECLHTCGNSRLAARNTLYRNTIVLNLTDNLTLQVHAGISSLYKCFVSHARLYNSDHG